MPKKYDRKAQKSVEKAMHEMKRGKLKSGKSNKKVKSRKQAIAIALSQARKKGAKAPKKRDKKTAM
jgi:DNA-directed RNA polymerase beta' subunit